MLRSPSKSAAVLVGVAAVLIRCELDSALLHQLYDFAKFIVPYSANPDMAVTDRARSGWCGNVANAIRTALLLRRHKSKGRAPRLTKRRIGVKDRVAQLVWRSSATLCFTATGR